MMATPVKSSAIFTVAGIGSTRAYCDGLDEDVEIEAETSQSKTREAFYPRHAVASGFSVSLKFNSGTARNAFTKWMNDYAIRLANGASGSMQVSIPAINFVARGIPKGAYPRKFEAISGPVKTVVVQFERLDAGFTRPSDEPVIPADRVVSRFYPTGLQSGEAMRIEVDLYDSSVLVDPKAMAEGWASVTGGP